jgi:hypothetical protein
MTSRDPAAEAAFRTEVRGNLRRNYLAHLAHGLLGQTGMRLVNAPTFVPYYISVLAGFDAAAGIARGLQYLGMFLSPVLGATIIEHRRRVLPVGFAIGALMRVQVLGLALGGLLLPDPWRLVTAWLFLALFGFLLGIQGVVFNFLVSKVIPVERRGVLMGLRNALAGLTAAAVAVYAGTLVARNALDNGYAATFLLAFGLTSVGLLMLLFVREPASPQVREPSRVRERLRQLPALLRSDRAFTRYFLARATATIGRMAAPFYVLYAPSRATSSPAPRRRSVAWPRPSTCCTRATRWGSVASNWARSRARSSSPRVSAPFSGVSSPTGAGSVLSSSSRSRRGCSPWRC